MDSVTSYYVNQAGSGLASFTGQRYQKGGGFFSSLWNRIGLPVLKFLGRQAVDTGLNVAADALDGRNFKESAMDHLKHGGRNTVDYLKQMNQQQGRGGKVRKKRKKTIKRMLPVQKKPVRRKKKKSKKVSKKKKKKSIFS